RLCRIGQLGFTPDGPRGPRRRVQPGLVYLASRTGLPIVPFRFAYGSAWRTRSWGRVALPKPWTDAICVMGAPIAAPENLDKDGLETYRLLVEEQMNDMTARAERLVARRRGGPSRDAAESAPGGDRGREQTAARPAA